MSNLLGHYNYWIVIVLMMTGFYVVIARPNLIKKVIGLFIFQTSVFILFISMAKIEGGSAPILEEGISVYSNPLPHVLILTAIVVSLATTALGLALIVRIREAYGTTNEDEIHVQDEQD
ncbi:MAG: cation:proton antiporter subunit C [Gammaproteobacteria bacterium]|jgi:multicomponent Na+:H+ antiporter subunit C|nr:cation:proton antiporter subunit C [Gammaproteobacteria bacterium]MDH3889330.1 cation:proton antiporter subunit C [Gammaproteobacteria bacterium]